MIYFHVMFTQIKVSATLHSHCLLQNLVVALDSNYPYHSSIRKQDLLKRGPNDGKQELKYQ
jgi:hypothetical protein